MATPQTVVERIGAWPASGEVAAPPAAIDAASRMRWIAVGVFVVFSALNYLDRQILAAVAPSVMAEFGLSNAAYGTLLAAFSLTYLCVAPVAGLFVDRMGLGRGAMLAVGAWSLATVVTGLTSSFRALMFCRMGLGVAEAAGLPCAGKGNAVYLKPGELGLGTAVHSAAMTSGIIVAPLIVAMITPHYGWRGAFVICGLAGLLWIPLWYFTSRRIPPPRVDRSSNMLADARVVLRDPRMWGILAANTLIMTVHSMWMNWTTVYLVQMHHLTQAEANQYFAWIPPIFASLGGLFGAALTLRLTRRGRPALATRMRLCLLFAPGLLVTALVPLMPTPGWAAAAISLSFFICLSILTNLHVIPFDLFGASRAGFTTALLVSSYAAMQMVLSPTMGAIADGLGFGALCVVVSVLPLVAAVVLRATVPVERAA